MQQKQPPKTLEQQIKDLEGSINSLQPTSPKTDINPIIKEIDNVLKQNLTQDQINTIQGNITALGAKIDANATIKGDPEVQKSVINLNNTLIAKQNLTQAQINTIQSNITALEAKIDASDATIKNNPDLKNAITKLKLMVKIQKGNDKQTIDDLNTLLEQNERCAQLATDSEKKEHIIKKIQSLALNKLQPLIEKVNAKQLLEIANLNKKINDLIPNTLDMSKNAELIKKDFIQEINDISHKIITEYSTKQDDKKQLEDLQKNLIQKSKETFIYKNSTNSEYLNNCEAIITILQQTNNAFADKSELDKTLKEVTNSVIKSKKDGINYLIEQIKKGGQQDIKNTLLELNEVEQFIKKLKIKEEGETTIDYLKDHLIYERFYNLNSNIREHIKNLTNNNQYDKINWIEIVKAIDDNHKTILNEINGLSIPQEKKEDYSEKLTLQMQNINTFYKNFKDISQNYIKIQNQLKKPTITKEECETLQTTNQGIINDITQQHTFQYYGHDTKKLLEDINNTKKILGEKIQQIQAEEGKNQPPPKKDEKDDIKNLKRIIDKVTDKVTDKRIQAIFKAINYQIKSQSDASKSAPYHKIKLNFIQTLHNIQSQKINQIKDNYDIKKGIEIENTINIIKGECFDNINCTEDKNNYNVLHHNLDSLYQKIRDIPKQQKKNQLGEIDLLSESMKQLIKNVQMLFYDPEKGNLEEKIEDLKQAISYQIDNLATDKNQIETLNDLLPKNLQYRKIISWNAKDCKKKIQEYITLTQDVTANPTVLLLVKQLMIYKKQSVINAINSQIDGLNQEECTSLITKLSEAFHVINDQKDLKIKKASLKGKLSHLDLQDLLTFQNTLSQQTTHKLKIEKQQTLINKLNGLSTDRLKDLNNMLPKEKRYSYIFSFNKTKCIEQIKKEINTFTMEQLDQIQKENDSRQKLIAFVGKKENTEYISNLNDLLGDDGVTFWFSSKKDNIIKKAKELKWEKIEVLVEHMESIEPQIKIITKTGEKQIDSKPKNDNMNEDSNNMQTNTEINEISKLIESSTTFDTSYIDSIQNKIQAQLEKAQNDDNKKIVYDIQTSFIKNLQTNFPNVIKTQDIDTVLVRVMSINQEVKKTNNKFATFKVNNDLASTLLNNELKTFNTNIIKIVAQRIIKDINDNTLTQNDVLNNINSLYKHIQELNNAKLLTIDYNIMEQVNKAFVEKYQDRTDTIDAINNQIKSLTGSNLNLENIKIIIGNIKKAAIQISPDNLQLTKLREIQQDFITQEISFFAIQTIQNPNTNVENYLNQMYHIHQYLLKNDFNLIVQEKQVQEKQINYFNEKIIKLIADKINQNNDLEQSIKDINELEKYIKDVGLDKDQVMKDTIDDLRVKNVSKHTDDLNNYLKGNIDGFLNNNQYTDANKEKQIDNLIQNHYNDIFKQEKNKITNQELKQKVLEKTTTCYNFINSYANLNLTKQNIIWALDHINNLSTLQKDQIDEKIKDIQQWIKNHTEEFNCFKSLWIQNGLSANVEELEKMLIYETSELNAKIQQIQGMKNNSQQKIDNEEMMQSFASNDNKEAKLVQFGSGEESNENIIINQLPKDINEQIAALTDKSSVADIMYVIKTIYNSQGDTTKLKQDLTSKIKQIIANVISNLDSTEDEKTIDDLYQKYVQKNTSDSNLTKFFNRKKTLILNYINNSSSSLEQLLPLVNELNRIGQTTTLQRIGSDIQKISSHDNNFILENIKHVAKGIKILEENVQTLDKNNSIIQQVEKEYDSSSSEGKCSLALYFYNKVYQKIEEMRNANKIDSEKKVREILEIFDHLSQTFQYKVIEEEKQTFIQNMQQQGIIQKDNQKKIDSRLENSIIDQGGENFMKNNNSQSQQTFGKQKFGNQPEFFNDNQLSKLEQQAQRKNNIQEAYPESDDTINPYKQQFQFPQENRNFMENNDGQSQQTFGQQKFGNQSQFSGNGYQTQFPNNNPFQSQLNNIYQPQYQPNNQNNQSQLLNNNELSKLAKPQAQRKNNIQEAYPENNYTINSRNQQFQFPNNNNQLQQSFDKNQFQSQPNNTYQSQYQQNNENLMEWGQFQKDQQFNWQFDQDNNTMRPQYDEKSILRKNLENNNYQGYNDQRIDKQKNHNIQSEEGGDQIQQLEQADENQMNIKKAEQQEQKIWDQFVGKNGYKMAIGLNVKTKDNKNKQLLIQWNKDEKVFCEYCFLDERTDKVSFYNRDYYTKKGKKSDAKIITSIASNSELKDELNELNSTETLITVDTLKNIINYGDIRYNQDSIQREKALLSLKETLLTNLNEDKGEERVIEMMNIINIISKFYHSVTNKVYNPYKKLYTQLEKYMKEIENPKIEQEEEFDQLEQIKQFNKSSKIEKIKGGGQVNQEIHLNDFLKSNERNYTQSQEIPPQQYNGYNNQFRQSYVNYPKQLFQIDNDYQEQNPLFYKSQGGIPYNEAELVTAKEKSRMRADELAEEAQRIKEDNQAKKDKLKEEIMLAKEVKERLRKKKKEDKRDVQISRTVDSLSKDDTFVFWMKRILYNTLYNIFTFFGLFGKIANIFKSITIDSFEEAKIKRDIRSDKKQNNTISNKLTQLYTKNAIASQLEALQSQKKIQSTSKINTVQTQSQNNNLIYDDKSSYGNQYQQITNTQRENAMKISKKLSATRLKKLDPQKQQQ